MINLQTILAIVLAYLAGSIPTSVWVGKLFYGVDVRQKGSGNAGATNTMRVLGLKAGIPVIIVDILKGWFAVYLAHFFHRGLVTPDQLTVFRIILGSAAVIGHVFPAFAGFRGGKGVATLLGVGIALYPLASVMAVTIFILIFIITGYVSLSSIIAAVTFPVIDIVILHHQSSIPLIVLAIAVGVFIPVTHRKNIKRLLQGEEKKFTLKKKDDTQIPGK
jgi:glycerol-3-phosphate acyltransferase PlsY